MNTIYTKAPEVRHIAAMAFPSYRGDKFKVSTSAPSRLDSCWQGGSRDFYALIDLGTGQSIAIPENGTPFSNGGQIFTLAELPANIALIQHTIFCGKDLGITVYVNAVNLGKWLPAPVELTQAEKNVLAYTRERKSSYNGRNRQQMAFDDLGMPADQWENAKAGLIAKGLLKSNGAITDEGRNAIGTVQCFSLPKWA